MRILKFAGVFLATLLIIFFIAFGYNLDTLFTVFENRKGLQEGQQWIEKTYSLEGLTEYIGEQPAHVSIASYAINHPDSSIRYNIHEPRTMGRLAAIFLTIEYARQVEQGLLNPEEQIPFEAINRYQLPYMDASNHNNALNKLREWQEKDDASVALKYIVDASVAYNDLAIFDYLFYKLGLDNIEQLLTTLSIKETESLLPFSGLYITLNPHLKNRATTAHFDSLSQLSRDEFNRRVLANAKRFINNTNYRQQVTALFNEHEGLGIKFVHQRDALAFFPKTTAAEMANLMKQLQQEKLLSTAISKKVKGILKWPMRKGSRLQKYLKSYGAIYDNRLGMVNGINFGTSSYTGEPFAQAVFFDNLQIAFWFHMSSNLMHQDFEQRLIWDPSLRQATIEQITDSKSDTTSIP